MRTFLSCCLPVAFCCLAAVAPCKARAQWNALFIPDSLKKNARAVLREEEIVLEIKSPGKAVKREHYVYTILNENGDNFGGITTFYGRFNTINSVSCTLYDLMGKEVKRVKKKDMEDRAAYDGISLMMDERYKEFNFYYRNYPYTVDFQEEDDYDGILDFSDWYPLPSSGVSTQHSKYVIIAPKDYVVRYKPVNCTFRPVITETGDKTVYTWEAWNLRAQSSESSGPSWRDMAPHVLLAPSDFEAEGYKGNMSTWLGFGKFINQLRTGRDVLPEDIKKKVHELTDNLKDPHQKVAALYDFLQKNTHYISIQLGIGGWQPFPADYVATKRYGDCKALSNYMVALLKEAGITGNYVVIYGGRDEPSWIPDFPSMQGNHVITCVPLKKDTMWLECTSQTVSPGFMGSFTGNRKALLIDESGGHIVNTPVYTAADNLQCRVVNAEINDEGTLDAEVNTEYTGISQELPHNLIDEYPADEREKYLNSRMFDLATYKIDKSHYEEQKGAKPRIEEYLHVVAPNYASVSGRRLFIAPDLLDKSETRLPADSSRKYDYIYDHSYTDVDSVSIKIPSGYQPESIPKDVHIENKFGKYIVSVRVLPDKIVYYRDQEESASSFPPADYPGIVKFYDQIYKADHSRVVLVKKE
jgi:hypothetical protein